MTTEARKIYEVAIENSDGRERKYWIAAGSISVAMTKGMRHAKKDFQTSGFILKGLKVTFVSLKGTVDA